MYNFRYHLVTIVAIFAALVIGLLFGIALTGSDLVRDASSNLAQSLSDEFDELSQENSTLESQLQTEQQFSTTLQEEWQAGRLQGRSIVILERGADNNPVLTDSLNNLVVQAGGIPIMVTIDGELGLGINDEQRNAELTQLVPAVANEEYSLTLAKALVKEWSLYVNSREGDVSNIFSNNYRLTTELVNSQAITINVDYTEVSTELLALEQAGSTQATVQLAAYNQAQNDNLPYAVNGIIDAAVSADESGALELDADALNIAFAVDEAGRNGALPYIELLNASARDALSASLPPDADATEEEAAQVPPFTGVDSIPSDTALETAASQNYFAVLVVDDEAANKGIAAANDLGLSCIFSPNSTPGNYNVIALLSGGTRGNFGLGHNGIEAFVALPTDLDGNLAFK